jgi:tRNA threonylcarbamoyladenosine biosynthesis protein TsaB
VKILAVETSGMEASIALAVGDQLVAEQTLDTAGRRNARLLIPAVDDLLKQASLAPVEIDVVAVSIGPGSFTGLRVGVVFAKTFAWVNNAKLVAVDTLQALAQRAAPTDCEVTVINDAQRGDVFVNSYHGTEVMEPTGAVRIESLEAVLTGLQTKSDSLLTGPGVTHFADQLPDSLVTAEADHQMPQASALLPLARTLIFKEQWSDLDTLEPVYLRRSYAEEKQNVGRMKSAD